MPKPRTPGHMRTPPVSADSHMPVKPLWDTLNRALDAASEAGITRTPLLRREYLTRCAMECSRAAALARASILLLTVEVEDRARQPLPPAPRP